MFPPLWNYWELSSVSQPLRQIFLLCFVTLRSVLFMNWQIPQREMQGRLLGSLQYVFPLFQHLHFSQTLTAIAALLRSLSETAESLTQDPNFLSATDSQLLRLLLKYHKRKISTEIQTYINSFSLWMGSWYLKLWLPREPSNAFEHMYVHGLSYILYCLLILFILRRLVCNKIYHLKQATLI